MKSGIDGVAYIDNKGFNIKDIDNELLTDLFNTLIRDMGNRYWCPSKEEIELLCCEVYKRRIYSLTSTFAYRNAILTQWESWNNKVNNWKSPFEPIIDDQYVGGIHSVAVDPSNSWQTITLDTTSLTYPNSGITYNGLEFDRLRDMYDSVQNNIENVWQQYYIEYTRHEDYQDLITTTGENVHHYRCMATNTQYIVHTPIDIYINTGDMLVTERAIDDLYVRIKNDLLTYCETCSYQSLLRLKNLVWDRNTLDFNDMDDNLILSINNYRMGEY